MKKILIVLILNFVGGFSAFSQMQKGAWMLNGELGLSRIRNLTKSNDPGFQTMKSNPVTSFILNPGIGYFVSDKTVFGVQGLLGNTWKKDDSDVSNSPNSYNVFSFGGGVFLRNYVPSGEKTAFFWELESDYSRRNYVWRYKNPSSKEVSGRDKCISAGMNLGLQYLISNRIGVHVSTPILQYTSRLKGYSKDFEGFPEDYFSIQFLKSFNLGASIFL
ncbi:hypothetical protein [Algoriphagus sp. CAU 1675]|uniref:hypothetical protein n=1 Tax=Algoriphagus sp. CAU 1675 TaxID=3032597 RepID=UPI0023DB6F39|nr:hypothetical protein [Algoriphagus sp. CAU 1675]MDF2156673.1 hypothetical protein [Algoriphagus sp. CAU 1675]